jgi:hypothetical protein
MTAQRAALRRVKAFLDVWGDVPRDVSGTHHEVTGRWTTLRVADLGAVCALAERAAEAERLRKALRWAADALENARTEGLLGFDGDDPTDTERAAEIEFQENMTPIRAALAPPRAGKRSRKAGR